MRDCQIKGLGIKLLVAWPQKRPQKNSSANLSIFSLAAQSLHCGLKALLCSLLSFSLPIFQLFVLCRASILRLFALRIFATYAPLAKTNERTEDNHKGREKTREDRCCVTPEPIVPSMLPPGHCLGELLLVQCSHSYIFCRRSSNCSHSLLSVS